MSQKILTNGDLPAEMLEKHFRIALFGSARITSEDPLYTQVHTLAKSIGERGFDIVTGGGPGLMAAANSGHIAGRGKNGSHSIGLTIKLPTEIANTHLDIKEHFERFSQRLDQFMVLSQVVVVMPGGIGTCLELLYSWQLAQVKHICSIPIILYGEMWSEFLKWIESYPLKSGYIGKEDMHNIFLAKTEAEVMQKILQFHEVYEKEGEDYCLNYNLYKII